MKRKLRRKLKPTDVHIKTVRVLGGRAYAEAKRKGCDDEDLVIVRTFVTMRHPLPRYEIEKIVGSPTQYLFDRTFGTKRND
jgi:hypothetical protein